MEEITNIDKQVKYLRKNFTSTYEQFKYRMEIVYRTLVNNVTFIKQHTETSFKSRYSKINQFSVFSKSDINILKNLSKDKSKIKCPPDIGRPWHSHTKQICLC